MKEQFFTEQLLDLLQKQSYYAGKLSTISEIDEVVSRVELPEESAVLNEIQYYHSNKGEPMIKLYNEQGFFLRDGKRLIAAQRLAQQVVKENAFLFGRPSDEQIEKFGISPKGLMNYFGDVVIDTVAREEGLEYEDVIGMLTICRKLGLISQLKELSQVEGMDVATIENMMYAECVDVMQRLEYSDSYDLARDVYTYSNFNLEDYDSIVDAALALGDNFDQGIDILSKNKAKVRVLL